VQNRWPDKQLPEMPRVPKIAGNLTADFADKNRWAQIMSSADREIYRKGR